MEMQRRKASKACVTTRSVVTRFGAGTDGLDEYLQASDIRVGHLSRLRAFQNFSGVSDFRAQDVVLHSQPPPHRPGDASRLSALL